MKGAFRGLQNTTTRFSLIGQTMPALTGLLVFLSPTAFGQVMLDDFSTDNRLKYAFTRVETTTLPICNCIVPARSLENFSESAFDWLDFDPPVARSGSRHFLF